MRVFLLFAIVALAAVAAPLAAPNVQVIANPAIHVDGVSANDLREIFLGSKTTLGGDAVEPVFVQSGDAHELFLKTYLGKSDLALRNHFKTLVFTGKGTQPKTFASDAEVVKYVLRTKSAIGYVSGGTDVGGARKLRVK